MTKMHESHIRNATGTTYTLSELPNEEIAEILEDCPPNPEATTCPEDEPLPTIGEIKNAESIVEELRYSADLINQLDCRMLQIRDRIELNEQGDRVMSEWK